MTESKWNELLAEEQAVRTDGNLVHGVAIGDGDVSTGMSGESTHWPAAVLRDAVDKLRGKPVTKDHPGVESSDGGLSVSAQPPVDSVIGKITDAAFKEGVGLLFEAEITDSSILSKIKSGLVEVSPVVSRALEESTDEDGNARVSAINDFRDLGIVARGASPSASIAPGESTAMAEALSDAFGVESHTIPQERIEALGAKVGVDVPANLSYDEATDTIARVDERIEERRDAVESLRGALSEALAEQWGTTPDKLRGLSLTEMRDEIEPQSESRGGALQQVPETGQPDMSRTEPDLSREEKEEVALLETRIEKFDERGWEAAASNARKQLAELTGDYSVLEESTDEDEPIGIY